ncbi:hypothetical protein AB4Z48_16875 [Cupriavidus sp. 2TAF22]
MQQQICKNRVVVTGAASAPAQEVVAEIPALVRQAAANADVSGEIPQR